MDKNRLKLGFIFRHHPLVELKAHKQRFFWYLNMILHLVGVILSNQMCLTLHNWGQDAHFPEMCRLNQQNLKMDRNWQKRTEIGFKFWYRLPGLTKNNKEAHFLALVSSSTPSQLRFEPSTMSLTLKLGSGRWFSRNVSFKSAKSQNEQKLTKMDFNWVSSFKIDVLVEQKHTDTPFFGIWIWFYTL